MSALEIHICRGGYCVKKFEYKVVRIEKKYIFTSFDKYVNEFMAKLNRLGAEGWELVAISGNVSDDNIAFQVFKREIS